MVAHPSLLTQDVTGARYAATNGDPASMVVPGAASVTHDGAGLYTDAALTPDGGTGAAPATLALATRLRVDGAYPAVNGSAVYAVHTLDGSQSGFMSGADLKPRDSQAPSIWTADSGTGAFSPNGDAAQDTFRVTGQISEAAAWTVTFSDASHHVLRTVHGTGNTYDARWDGIVGGSAVPDGSYTWTIAATDGWGNPDGTRSGTATVDTIAPELVATSASVVTPPIPPTFSPNGDGVGDTFKIAYDTTEAGFIDVTVEDASSHVVRRFSATTGSGVGGVTWLGDTDTGGYAADGTYTVAFAPRDPAGNVGTAETQAVVVYASLSSVKASVHTFFPQDGDAYAKSTALSFHLANPATVTWTLSDAAGTPVYTRYDATALAAGTYSWTWDGRNPAGAYAARGVYRLTVTATDGNGAWTQYTTVRADAFGITSSDTTPARGEWITITAVSAETLSTSARLTISQPGHLARTVTLTKMSSTKYRVRIHLLSTGAGQLVLKVTGRDLGGKVNSSKVTFTIH
jgi:flagellar hook assembly protein FlgD